MLEAARKEHEAGKGPSVGTTLVKPNGEQFQQASDMAPTVGACIHSEQNSYILLCCILRYKMCQLQALFWELQAGSRQAREFVHSVEQRQCTLLHKEVTELV